MNDDPFSSNADQEERPITTSHRLSPELARLAEISLARQEIFRRAIGTLHELWTRLPEIDPRQADSFIVLAHQQLMELAPLIGVSRNGLPELRECCGKKRVWPAGLLRSPSETLDHVVVPLGTFEELGWWPGDIIRRITRFFGAAYCEKCDKRRRAINRFFGKKS